MVRNLLISLCSLFSRESLISLSSLQSGKFLCSLLSGKFPNQCKSQCLQSKFEQIASKIFLLSGEMWDYWVLTNLNSFQPKTTLFKKIATSQKALQKKSSSNGAHLNYTHAHTKLKVIHRRSSFRPLENGKVVIWTSRLRALSRKNTPSQFCAKFMLLQNWDLKIQPKSTDGDIQIRTMLVYIT